MTGQDNGAFEKKSKNPESESAEYENFQRLLKQVLSVPKEEVDKKRQQEDREKQAS